MTVKEFYGSEEKAREAMKAYADVELYREARLQPTIIGGGESGSFGAWTLLLKGRLVLLVTGPDETDFPRPGEAVVVTTFAADPDTPDEPDPDEQGSPVGGPADGAYPDGAAAVAALRQAALIS